MSKLPNPPKDQDWSPWYHKTSHMILYGRQYTVQNCEKFAELTIFDWNNEWETRKFVFFVRGLDENSVNAPNKFWGCETIENAVQWAKHYAEGGNLGYDKDNLGWQTYHEDECWDNGYTSDMICPVCQSFGADWNEDDVTCVNGTFICSSPCRVIWDGGK